MALSRKSTDSTDEAPEAKADEAPSGEVLALARERVMYLNSVRPDRIIQVDEQLAFRGYCVDVHGELHRVDANRNKVDALMAKIAAGEVEPVSFSKPAEKKAEKPAEKKAEPKAEEKSDVADKTDDADEAEDKTEDDDKPRRRTRTRANSGAKENAAAEKAPEKTAE